MRNQPQENRRHFIAGRKFFELVGKGALYDAEMTALDKQLEGKA